MFSSIRRRTAFRSVALAVLAASRASALVVPAGLTVSAGAATRATASFPVTVHAANGKVTIATRPTAIVSLSPTATEMLYAIGAGSQIKAVDEFSDFPKNAPKTQLDGNNPNVEAIAQYKPDLVIVSDEAPSVDQQIEALGVPVLSDPAADQAHPGVRAVRRARPGDGARHPGEGRGGQDQGADRAHRGLGAQAVAPAELLLRARPDLLLGDVEHVHRAGARAARPAQHRRRRQGRRRGRRATRS